MKLEIKNDIFKYEIEIVCIACDGSGLYAGSAERDGAYVVCAECNGTGKILYKKEHKLFKNRKILTAGKVKRVFGGNGGYCISADDFVSKDGEVVPFSKYGCTYEEFLAGKEPGYIECLMCPMTANQSACHKIKGFAEECDILNSNHVLCITACKHHNKKSECWERFKKGKDKLKEVSK